MESDDARRRTAVIVTRPEPDAIEFAAILTRLGLRPVLAPVLTIRNLQSPEFGANLDAGAVVAFTSANGVRSVRAPADGVAFAVGAATAAAARETGWARVVAAEGDVASLADLIAATHGERPFGAPITHIAGSHRAGDLVALLHARGVPAFRRVTYEAVAADRLNVEAATLLASGLDPVIATFFSARSATIFMDLIGSAGGSRWLEHADAVCLSAAVARPLDLGSWRRVAIAGRPDAEGVAEAVLNLSAQRRP